MNGKKAFISGNLGLVGRHMQKRLIELGWDTVGVDIKSPGSSEDCREFFRNVITRFDLVVHAAYHVGGRAGIDGVNTNFAQNVELDGAMFEWAVRTQQKHVLYFSSSAAYPIHFQGKDRVDNVPEYSNKPRRMLWEKHINLDIPWLPDGSYGWAKLTGEKLAEDARRSGLMVSVVRPFSGYAEDQDPDEYPLPATVRKAIAGDYCVWGPKGQTRDWIHMDDVITACLAIVEAQHPGPVNLCTGNGVEFGDLMRMVVKVLRNEYGDPYPHPHQITVRYMPDKPTGVFYRVGSPRLMNSFHMPSVSILEGITRTVRFMKG